MITIPNRTFDAAKHEYRLAGDVLPSVTKICSFGKPPYECDPWYGQRGIAVHTAIQFYEEGALDWKALDDRIKPFITKYLRFRHATGFRPVHIEQPVVSFAHRYAGRIDLIGTFPDSKDLCIVDAKSGGCGTIAQQNAAYGQAANECGLPITRTFVLWLGKEPYKLAETGKRGDPFKTFLDKLKSMREAEVFA